MSDTPLTDAEEDRMRTEEGTLGYVTDDFAYPKTIRAVQIIPMAITTKVTVSLAK